MMLLRTKLEDIQGVCNYKDMKKLTEDRRIQMR